MANPSAPSDRPRIGVSSCLLGEKVRFDGGHKRDGFIADVLAPFVELVAVCPEVEVGMGVPREPVRLVVQGDLVRLRGVKSDEDHTARMAAYCKRRVAELAGMELDGYLLKKNSPSCGLARVKVYAESGGPPARDGRGLFAAALCTALPDLPVEEEGRLSDLGLRDGFVTRVFAYRRLRALFATPRLRAAALIAFHTREKLLLLAHSQTGYRALGRLVADATGAPSRAFAAQYRTAFMAALARPATTRSHTNVLQHMAGYFKQSLDPADRAELATAIDDFRLGRVPWLAPVTLLRHHARRHAVGYLLQQSYLSPHPKELLLRHHA